MMRRTRFILTLIVLLGASVRLWGLGAGELAFDEGLYAFRSIGYLDYLESAAQPTPIQWLADVPALPSWLKLSFHDHPPLLFVVQHGFFRVLGDSLFAARLPSALAGTASMFLFFLIVRALARKLGLAGRERLGLPGDEIAGLAAALLASVSFALVWVSRTAMLEALLIFLVLLNLYLFLRFLDQPRRWLAFGAMFGLALLTKYVGVFLIPAYAALLALYRPLLLRDWRLWAALLVAVAVFLPVIVYNVNFYRAFGHFDLQFSYLLNQATPEWQGASGKTQEPFSNLFENLAIIFSIPFLAAALAALAALLWPRRFPAPWPASRLAWFPFLLAAAVTLLLILTGSAIRFSALYAVPAVMVIALFAAALGERAGWRWFFWVPLGAFLAYEVMFTLNRAFLDAPHYGAVRLDQYFDRELGPGRGPGVPRHPNPHLDRVIQTYALPRPATLPPTGIIYDENLSLSPILWLFSRRQYYHGIPVMPAGAFRKALEENGTDAFRGFQLYFVKAGPGAPLRQASSLPDADEVERLLATQHRKPDLAILAGDGEFAFKVYKFSMQ